MTAWKIVFFAFVVIFSSVGNSLILYVLYKFKNVRFGANIIIGGIAIADFMRCLIFAGSALGRAPGHNYVLGAFWCKNENFFKLSLNMVVRLSIIAMVTQRLGNVFWRSSQNAASANRAYVTALAIWTFASIGVLILTSYFWTWDLHIIEWKDYREVLCENSDMTGKGFWIAYVSTFLYIPLFMLLAMYSTVWYLNWKYSKVLRESNMSQTGHQLKNGILLFYVTVAILSEIPAQVYIIKKFIHVPDGPKDVSLTYYLSNWLTGPFTQFECRVLRI